MSILRVNGLHICLQNRILCTSQRYGNLEYYLPDVLKVAVSFSFFKNNAGNFSLEKY